MLGDGGDKAAFGKYVEHSGLDMGWPIHMNGNRVTGLPTPSADTDAVPWGCVGGFGLGSEKCNTDYTHANDCLAAGWYRVAFDVPFNDAYWLLRTDCYGSGYCKQTTYAIASTSSIDSMCVCRRYQERGDWSEWEWENPPMKPGEEYRTTKRFFGEPVYTKCISYSPASFVAQTVSLPHEISNFGIGISINVSWEREAYQWRHFPSSYFGTSAWSSQVYWNSNDSLYFELGESIRHYIAASYSNIYVTVEYTKTT